MCRNLKYIVFFLLFFQQPIFSNNIAISLDSGYCWGATWLGIQNYQTSDTINSSTQLSFKIIPSPEYIPTSGNSGLSYFLTFLTNSYQKIGYKFDKQISREPYKPSPVLSTQSLNNPDTIWNSVHKFPDSLLLLDSLNTLVYNNKDTIYSFIGMGKWCFKNFTGDMVFGCFYYKTWENYNAIIYALCHDNRKIKLQVDNFHKIISKPYPPCGPDYDQIDSVHILWAADSMGNGIFKHPPVSAMDQSRPNFPGISQSFDKINIQSTTNSVEFNLPSKSSPIKSLKIYSLKGSLVNQWQNPGRSISWRIKGVMAGVYLADIQFQNQLHTSRIFVIKK